MTATSVVDRPVVVASFGNAADARTAEQAAAAAHFTDGHKVGMKTESSMGTVTSWNVVVWPVHHVDVDTSCVDCGTGHVCGRCPQASR